MQQHGGRRGACCLQTSPARHAESCSAPADNNVLVSQPYQCTQIPPLLGMQNPRLMMRVIVRICEAASVLISRLHFAVTMFALGCFIFWGIYCRALVVTPAWTCCCVAQRVCVCMYRNPCVIFSAVIYELCSSCNNAPILYRFGAHGRLSFFSRVITCKSPRRDGYRGHVRTSRL